MFESEPTAARDRPPRLFPQRELPPYSYVTGKFPHPIRDAAGHQFGQSHPVEDPLNPSRWRASASYRFGIDLFNHGFYWEAHEAWEGLWHAAGRTGTVGDFLKGLIKLAAAGVKAREGRAEGVRRHATRAHELFCATAATGRNVDEFAGLSLESMTGLCDRLVTDPQRFVNTSNDPVVIVFPALETR